MRRRPPLLLALLVAAACGRTAPEDFSTPVSAPVAIAPSVAVTGTTAVPVVRPLDSPPAGRCILPTPSDPPPPVPQGPAAGCPADPEADGTPVPMPVVRVDFPSGAQADGRAVSVDAEVVRSQHDTTRGLMYRTRMAEDRGMLFDLGVHEDHKFWMHNTCIPLDLLYIDDDGLVVGIVENAPTLNDEARGVGCPSSFVLEVRAGWCRRHGVKAGQRVSLPAAARR